VTGVALVEADSSQQSSLAFFFGCVAETAGMGGAGLFVAGPNDAVGKVYRVRSNGSDIQAASVFVASSALACPSSAFPAAAPQQVAGSGSDRSALTHAQWSLAFAVVAAWAVLLRL
jgi:hypothetical protein